MPYISGSQPFLSRGPLDKFCLGSRTTKEISTFSGKIYDNLFYSFPLPKNFSVCALHKNFDILMRKILTTFFSHFLKFLAFFRDKHTKN